ncbi:MAG: Cytochrome oxidase biogenesis protein Sco1/SenC/PrrC, putative copper metallochaperone [Candidatus Carbobacillus altaicus]|uniref:Cytochrome oxidase biogenesis protein Sco1/SenC/PrrC, putative copper metallochaperone n=1 Tax=Candidatus Carbonibacillus altaicus TaxID=2163959 RepID=A0A2R6Y4F1_9BACL|nr:MAG: Cytochrome oxidase biogenesis protein Sco1/SenC/PrrC, putative copper metallochaperone [Candidatus Carbobacillus altaicus]
MNTLNTYRSLKQRRHVRLVFFVILGLGLLMSGCGSDADRLPKMGVAPDFTLEDVTGKPYQFHQDAGKVRLLSFIYTTCPTECPAMTHWMLVVQKELKAKGIGPDQVQFYSITFDPEVDTPEVMEDFIHRFKYQDEPIDEDYWRLLRGSVEATRQVAQDFHLLVQPLDDGTFIHSDKVILVDKEGEIRYLYNGSNLPVEDVIRDMSALVK